MEIKSSTKLRSELKEKGENEKVKGMNLALLRYLIGIIAGIFVLVILIIVHVLGLDPDDSQIIITAVTTITPFFALVCDVKLRDTQGDAKIHLEGALFTIFGFVLAGVIIIFGVFTGDWQETIIRTGIEFIGVIAAGILIHFAIG